LCSSDKKIRDCLLKLFVNLVSVFYLSKIKPN